MNDNPPVRYPVIRAPYMILRPLKSFTTQTSDPEWIDVEIGDDILPVIVRRSARARRMSLRVRTADRRVVLTLPIRTKITTARRFVAEQVDWIAGQIKDLPTARPFVDGATIPVRGIDHIVDHVGGRLTVRIDDDQPVPRVLVGGHHQHLPRRLTDWLKKQARDDLEAAASRYADRLGVSVGKVRVADQRSRWGSCSSSGTLSFSWRLILAPGEILRYVAAHEVAHLLEMNHSDRFWAHVEQIDPQYRRYRTWLRRHGSELHAYGANSVDNISPIA